MTHGDVAFAIAVVRGAHTALAAFKAWAVTQEKPSPEDEEFIKALEIAAGAAKDWVRHKAARLSKGE